MGGCFLLMCWGDEQMSLQTRVCSYCTDHSLFWAKSAFEHTAETFPQLHGLYVFSSV